MKALYTPTEKQAELHKDGTKFKVAVWGRRSGKSTFAFMESLAVCYGKDGARVWIVCPTYQQAKDIYWRGRDLMGKYLKDGMFKKKNENELLIEFFNGSILQLKGADRNETLRGSGLDLVIMDEVAEHRAFNETWEQILMPSLSDKDGDAIFIGTPKGYNHFYDLYQRGQKDSNYWRSWKVPTWDSGQKWLTTRWGKKKIKELKKEMTEDAYMQEYGADFRKHTGLVFKDFEKSIHIRDFEVDERYYIEAGMDFGYRNPTTCVFSYFDLEDNWYIFDEYGMSERPIPEHASRIRAVREQYQNVLKYVVGDSAASQEIMEFGECNWFVTPVAKVKDSVLTGISRIQERIKYDKFTKECKFVVHSRCKGLIKELQRYRWQDKRAGEESLPDVPEKAYDHYIDAIRYIILHHRKESSQENVFKPVKEFYKPRGGEY